jgi:hypothetical protein
VPGEIVWQHFQMKKLRSSRSSASRKDRSLIRAPPSTTAADYRRGIIVGGGGKGRVAGSPGQVGVDNGPIVRGHDLLRRRFRRFIVKAHRQPEKSIERSRIAL